MVLETVYTLWLNYSIGNEKTCNNNKFGGLLAVHLHRCQPVHGPKGF